MSIRQDREPVPLADAVAELLASPAARDAYVEHCCDGHIAELQRAYREGYLRGHEDAYEAGYAAGVAAFKAAQHDAHRLVDLDTRRWELRGEKRTRQTYGRPHPDDYRGGAA